VHMDFREGVPLKVVMRHRNGKVSAGRFQPVLGIDMENTLRDHIQRMEKALFRLTTNDVHHLAYEIAEKMAVNNPFAHKAKAAGYDWLRVFV